MDPNNFHNPDQQSDDEKKGINIIDNIDNVECLLILIDESNSISLEYSAGFEKFIVN